MSCLSTFRPLKIFISRAGSVYGFSVSSSFSQVTEFTRKAEGLMFSFVLCFIFPLFIFYVILIFCILQFFNYILSMMKLSLSKLFKTRSWFRSKEKGTKVTTKSSGTGKTNKVTIKVRFTDGEYCDIIADTNNYQTMFDQLSKLTGFGIEDTYGCRFNTFESHKYNGCLYLFNNRFVKNNGQQIWIGFEDKQLGKYVHLHDGTKFTLGVYYDLHDRVIIKYHLVDETIPDGNDLIRKKYFTHKHLIKVKEMIANDSSTEYIKNCHNRANLYLDSPYKYN